MNNLFLSFKKLGHPELRMPLFILLAFALLLGYMVSGSSEESAHQHSSQEMESGQIWTCSMHPQIRLPEPGACPICGMDLIPSSQGNQKDLAPRQLRLSASAAKLAAIQTAPVERKYVATEIRMTGKISMDETRLSKISAYMPGRIDRMFVDYTGTRVRKGDHLVELYSPQLITAQTELMQAKKTLDNLGESASPALRSSAITMLNTVREKLRLMGVTERQISAIEDKEKASTRLTIYSPISGIVTRRHASEGTYVQTGSPIYTVADLSRLWVMLDAYESDLEWIRYGQKVSFSVEAFPGETFTGIISFIDPVLNPTSRTVKIRVNVSNSDGRLKPEMLVRAVVQSRISTRGLVMDPGMAGKWICPMHPEIVKAGRNTCDICGMALVKAESMGYVAAGDKESSAPLVIPASAPLITGKRAVVYVALPGEEGRFEGRDVVLGPRSGNHYLVQEGLTEGEEVVVNGAFKLDSDLQIRGEVSMMSPTSEEMGKPNGNGAIQPVPEVPASAKTAIEQIASAYFDLQTALSKDDQNTARQHAGAVEKAVGLLDLAFLQKNDQDRYRNLADGVARHANSIGKTTDIAPARQDFENLSQSIYELVKGLGSAGKQSIARFFCPMAFNNKGAYWLQNHPEVENPYFGAAMFRCGEAVEQLVKGPAEDHEEHDHE